MDGLNKLQELKARLRNLPDATIEMMKEVFKDIAPVVEDLNIEQLNRGERADGSSLPNYSIVSVTKFGKTPGPMNLHDRGPFWQGITLEVHDDGVELVGKDFKTDMLQLRYGDEIIGLQEDNQRKVEQDYLKPELEPKFQKYLTL